MNWNTWLNRPRKTRREMLRENLALNVRRGKAAEREGQAMIGMLEGIPVRKHVGRDFDVEKWDPWSGARWSEPREIKSSATAPLSAAQKRLQQRNRNYRVLRIRPTFY